MEMGRRFERPMYFQSSLGYSNVGFKKNFVPNKFFYAVPDGLIDKKEVPKYAGLIYIKNGMAEIVKRAPFLHKRSNNLKHILLDKFYYLNQQKEQIIRQLTRDLENTGSDFYNDVSVKVYKDRAEVRTLNLFD